MSDLYHVSSSPQMCIRDRHICAQENTQTTESIFADYGDENGGETDTAEQITGTGAEENTEQTTEETETGKNTEQTTEETETGKNTEQTTETETGEIMDADDTEEAEESVWMVYDGTEEPEKPDEPELDEGFHPVSYTHLDVYKRQILPMREIWIISLQML